MEIYRTNVTGLGHSGYKLFASKVVPDLVLTMKRDPDNMFDKFAIKLLMPDGMQLGWVQKVKEDQENSGQACVARMLDDEFELVCKVVEVNQDKKEAEGKIVATISHAE